MRWLRVRTAQITPEHRELFERYGVMGAHPLLVSGTITYKGKEIHTDSFTEPILDWLTERFDVAERKDTWLFAMEVAIVIFVALEVWLTLFPRARCGS